jgi:hypothetical protein
MIRDRDRIYGTVGNITPDANTGIGSWSEQAFGRALPRWSKEHPLQYDPRGAGGVG